MTSTANIRLLSEIFLLISTQRPCLDMCCLDYLDMEDLKQFAKNQGAKEADDLSHWDIAFWTGRLLASKQEEHYIAIRKRKLRVIIRMMRTQNVLMRIKGQNNVMIRAIVTSTSGARCCLKQKMTSMRLTLSVSHKCV